MRSTPRRRHVADRLIALVARAISRGLFRSVEVVGFDDLPGGPRLIVANHFNGFVDPVVITGALGRLPRFIAKATLWRTPGVGVLLGAAGVLPVHRAVDGGGDNKGTFDSVVAELHRGETVAIFPEGTTHDDQHLAEVRTGAARLALDGAHDGVAGLHIVPVGVTFEDKVALRSRVVVRAGTPLDPATHRAADGTPAGSDDHEAVRALTAEIRGALADVSPDFGDLIDAVEMRRAADVALRHDRMASLAAVPLGDREQLAKDLDRLPEDAREPIARAAAEYQLLLHAVRIDDEFLAPRVSMRDLVVRAVVTTVAVLLLAPFALSGVLVNAVPALLVALAGGLATAPVSKGTNRVLAGIVAFPATWFLLANRDVGAGTTADVLQAVTLPLDPVLEAVYGTRTGTGPSLLVFVSAPIFGLLAVWLAEQVHRLWRTVMAVKANVSRRGQVGDLLTRRTALVSMVDEAVRPRRAAGPG